MVRYFDMPLSRIVCKINIPAKVKKNDEDIAKEIEHLIKDKGAIEITKSQYYSKRKSYTKEYGLCVDVIHECDGGSFMGYFSYGHHDNAKFVNAINEEFAESIELEDVEDQIEHKYCKSVPFKGTSTMMFDYVNEPRKYYKPITLLEI